MKTLKNILGSIIATLGLFLIFICGGGETIAACAICGLSGFVLLMIGGAMLSDKEEKGGDD